MNLVKRRRRQSQGQSTITATAVKTPEPSILQDSEEPELVDEPPPLPQREPEEPTQLPPTSESSDSQDQSSQSRQFHPPGPLVVVQGVVHTTDIPRQGSSQNPEPTIPVAAEPPAASQPVPEPSSTSAEPTLSESPAPPADTQAQPSAISSSSIDVLGTLLSVAAAATAASLLTGSAEPMQSSGLSSASPLEGPRPSLGIELGRAERMRQAWGSIRERLGLRPTPTTDPYRLPSTSAPTVADSATPSIDARERMLAEMARAFNVGLGISSGAFPPDSVAPTDPPTTSAASTAPEPTSSLAPEGSFERFLVDLQSDLRTALTYNADLADDRDGEEPDEDPQSESSARVSEREPEPVSESSTRDEPEPAESNDTWNLPSVPENTSTAVAAPDDNPPAEANRINWWRLYRFPAIVPPRIMLTGPAEASSSTSDRSESPSSSSSASLPAIPEPSSSSSSTSTSTSSDESEHSSTPSSTTSSNVVVPVIVVGLQSVNLNVAWGHFPPPPSPPPSSTPRSAPPSTIHPHSEGEHETEDSDGGVRSSRRWHSRAASAIRNLRPSSIGSSPRRESLVESDPNANAPPGGTRTFLIYVIGGYYPPDHSIVTGEARDLDSFAALLDLAELLGQVKPPTVSKDELEKSGLEVIKASMVKEYEEQGKITVSCIEKCLICLDDYDAEDDVRVMTCRHAFHRDCVDKWLVTGRNNCPACRSKGVPSSSTTEV